jgi:hypothetical protein
VAARATATGDATRAIFQAIRAGTWIAGQQHRLNQLTPGTWQNALAAVLAPRPGRPDDHSDHPAVDIAIYPDVIWLAARSLRACSASHRIAS